MNSRKKTTIGILGLGAIGTALASLLVNQDAYDLYLYNRSPKSALKIIQADQRVEIPVEVHTSFDSPVELDYLLICLKEYHFQTATEALQALIAPATKIVVIRNGLRLEAPILKYTSAENILAAMIDCPVQLEREGFYRMFYAPILTLKKSAFADDFSRLFPAPSIRINQVDDFVTASWKKLLESAALGAVLCLSGETCWILRDEKLRALYEQLLREGLAVARADGAQLEENVLSELLDKMKQYPSTKGSSMLSDRRAGRPIEIGAKNGAIVEVGNTHGIKTPLHELVCNLLRYTNVPQG